MDTWAAMFPKEHETGWLYFKYEQIYISFSVRTFNLLTKHLGISIPIYLLIQQ